MRIGIIGAGMIGGTLALEAARSGEIVVITIPAAR